jgi:hypothetical protein
LISIFRNNLLLNSILLLPYIIILRLKSFFLDSPYVASSSDSHIVKAIFSTANNVIAQASIAILIIFINAVMINRIMIKNNLSKVNNLVSGLIYGLFNSILLAFLPLSPELISSFFVILSLQSIFNSYNNQKASNEIFLSGFYMAIGALIYFPLVYLILITFVGFFIMRSFLGIGRIQHLIGWCVPFFLLFALEYYFQAKPLDFPSYFLGKITLNLFSNGLKLNEFLILAITVIFVIISVFSYNANQGKKVIASQKRISVLYWLLLVVSISAFLFTGTRLSHLHLVSIPLSIFFTYSLLEFKNNIIAEIIHLLLVILLVIIHLDLININS